MCRYTIQGCVEEEVGYKVLFSCADEVSAETEVNFSKAIGGRGKHSHKSKEIRNFGGCIGRMKSRRAWLKFTLVRVEVLLSEGICETERARGRHGCACLCADRLLV